MSISLTIKQRHSSEKTISRTPQESENIYSIKEWEKVKKEEEEGKKAPDQGSKEHRRNVQKGLWTGQYLNNTELSPNERKEGKETMT